MGCIQSAVRKRAQCSSHASVQNAGLTLQNERVQNKIGHFFTIVEHASVFSSVEKSLNTIMNSMIIAHNFIQLLKSFRNTLEKFYCFQSEPRFRKVQ